MKPDKAYINLLRGENHYRDQPVVIPLDIEYVPIVTHIVCTVERLLYVLKTVPFTSLGLKIPIPQRYAGVRIFKI